MSYKNEAYFKDVLINEVFYVANKNKKLVRLNSNNQDYVGVWTQEGQAEDYLKHASIDYDRVLKIDIDTFVTYELDDLFDEDDQVIINQTSQETGQIVKVVKMTDELMSELDKIRIKEFVKDVAKEDQVFGLSKHGENHFILISDDSEDKPQIMPVWSLKNRALKVRDEDFEECELIEIEGSVFSDWLDKLRDNDQAVAIDLKPGVVGTVISAQKLSNELTF
ncbi:hypothetical protein HMPREF2564_03305 [Staphylococcus sp. HMSC068D03]|uniref:DUF2750 domain-containing protein n=1 Tax=Staphylococcus haemolyticus TaxID=1283 RepID=A0A2J8BF30_STAHA|nr:MULTISPECIES: DUF2750 domain-containing protein [Staphylococcus]MBY6179582.1 DUF2750 domain-containing protein [Staphylococcaceae bacterium DP2N0-1]KGF26078.1 hypothetical protein HMPREF2135_09175 [Staphylococcus haemolyticus DNF00585]MCH4336990.1 DUF2750 domain-containing protein [Staphylococcus haemolyticus]MCH4355826.1 DUF2750 domain-containing protein [Staphylococcus haemolyticus]MCH4364443.1 DUF2750 domain-containing protein [Staphylococcus haemolyticus]